MLRHLPNFLTMMRLAAAPATAGLLLAGHDTAAFGVFAFAGLSDAADGFLAKRFNLTSRLGRVLDPVADKALMLALFATLTMLNVIPLWLTLCVIARDVVIVLGLATAAAAGAPLSVQPLLLGKFSAAVQAIYIGIHLAALAFNFSLAYLAPADGLAVAAFTLASLGAYAGVWMKAMQGVLANSRTRV